MKTQRRLFSTLSIIVVLLVTLVLPSSVFTASLRNVVISEIAWMGTTTSSYDEWIELYNNTGSTIDITGWTLGEDDGTPSIALMGTIPAGSYFLLERTDDTSVPGVASDLIYSGALDNDGEDLVLRDETSTIVDRVDCSSGWFAGHNDAKAKVPMVRVDTTEDGDLENNWTFNPRCGDATNTAGDSHVCTLTVYPVPGSLDYSVYFNELATTASGTTLDHTEMEDALLGLIDNATISIDMAIYGLNRQSVIDALVAAHNRGVTVRVVGDDDAAAGTYSTYYQQLTNAGITVRNDSGGGIQHNKFLVIDNSITWTGSTNFTDRGFTANANNNIVITDTTMASVYATEFEEMWSGKFHDDKEDDTMHLLLYDSGLVESFFSPTDIVAFEVWNELANADETIHFAMYYWTDVILADRAIERLDAGVEVWGVWDAQGITDDSSQDERLCDAGVRIGTEDLWGKVHHKFAVIDVNGSDPTVILGSYNWTKGGAYDNDENTLIIHDQDLALAYYAEWQDLWATVDLDRICNPPQLYLPIVLR